MLFLRSIARESSKLIVQYNPSRCVRSYSSLGVAKSLAELNRLGETATKLHLDSSTDIVCNDIQCERVTKPCACKLAVALEKSGKNLREVDPVSYTHLTLPTILRV